MSLNYAIIHRIKTNQTTVEHLISVIPNEGLSNTIDRIRPRANDEIVIKVFDDTIKPNVRAREHFIRMVKDSDDNVEEELKVQILTPANYENGPF